jgi:WD40 repeat protein
VLIRNEEFTCLLQDAKSVDLNSRVFNNLVPDEHYVTSACFSPNGQLLAFRLLDCGTLHILDTVSLKIRSKLSLHSMKGSKLVFVDDEHLLCEGYKSCLCLISVKTCDILTSISLGKNPLGVFACRNAVGVVVYSRDYAKFNLINLWLPQQRKDGNEFLECSCWIHAGKINDPQALSTTEIERFSCCSII